MTQSLGLLFLSGPLKDQTIEIRTGLRIGRSRGELILPDPLVSALHAQVAKHPKGAFVLVDKGSNNKILFQGTRVEKLALLPGIKFQLGASLIEVVEFDPTKATIYLKSTSEGLDSLKVINSSEGLNSDEIKILSWQDKLLLALSALSPHYHSQSSQITMPFMPPLIFKFTRGPEYNRVIPIGFGPRYFGSESMDILIKDSGLPPQNLFTVSPNSNGLPFFTTEFSSLVLINGKSYSEAILNHNDTLCFGSSCLKLTINHQEFMSL